jgi:hypothetical protein
MFFFLIVYQQDQYLTSNGLHTTVIFNVVKSGDVVTFLAKELIQ